jgi:hypothetical protein
MQMLSLGLVFLNLAHVKRGCFSSFLWLLFRANKKKTEKRGNGR